MNALEPPRTEAPDPIEPASALPLASMLLIGYNQEAVIGEAIAGALAQTYEPLEIVISDDASSDGTFAAMQRAVEGYAGPHTIRLNRNPVNLGVGAHLSRLVELSHGEMLFVTAGDDVSLPARCERVMQAWQEHDRRPDLIAAAMTDVDAQGLAHGTIVPTDLADYHHAADWLARPPFVVGAAQAWTRRLFDRFGPLRPGVVGEDLILVLRAIGSGGAITLAEPLVRYRRGGVSRRVRNLRAADVIARLRKNNRGALAELPQLLADAAVMGQLATVESALRARLSRERFVHEVFAAGAIGGKFRAVWRARDVALATRLRIGVYAICPWLYAPFFFVKRLGRHR